MAELKSFSSCRIYRAVDQVEWKAGDIDNLHLDDNLFYTKSDADAVIAEKDKEIDRISEQALDTINWQAKIIRHYKYRRCVAMAMWCENEDKRIEAQASLFDIDKECWEFVSDYWNRWHKRWLELAEKFKTN